MGHFKYACAIFETIIELLNDQEGTISYYNA